MLAKLLSWDRRGELRPAPIQGDEGQRLLAGMSVDEQLNSWHLADEEGVHSGGAAFSPALRRVPGGLPFAWLAERMPRLAERGYRAVASRRSAIGPRLTEGARRRADARIARRRVGEEASSAP